MNVEYDSVIKQLKELLPPPIHSISKAFIETYPEISEIRLRRDKAITFTLGERNIESGYICNKELLESCLSLWLGSARYKQSDNILKGMITLPWGFRAGIAGTVLLNDNKIDSIYDISNANLRIPRDFRDVAVPLYNFLTSLPFPTRSTLIISPPCNGKTTVLRDVARILSTPPVSERVCVVDTRSELFPYEDKRCQHMDVFKGYPLSDGINTAVKYFNPSYIICDEIGALSEQDAIRNACHNGIPMIASAHASSLSEAVLKPSLRMLLEERIFFNVVELRLSNGKLKYTFHARKEVDRSLCTQGCLLL